MARLNHTRRYLRIPALFAAAAMLATSLSAHADFKDNFTWGYKTGIWQARDGSNGSPFGCAFTPSRINPSSHGITLSVAPGECAELRTKQLYRYGKIQGSLKTGNTPGTVSSIFTYTSWWDAPGRAWQEIDIEFLPSYGNVVHTNLIYQQQGQKYYSWEKDINLGQFGLDVKQNLLHVGIDWFSWKIDWYVYDQWGNYRVIRTLYKDNGDGHIAGNEVPAWAWPKDPARIMINHWHGDNSAQAQYFPKSYNWQNAWAYYDYIEYKAR